MTLDNLQAPTGFTETQGSLASLKSFSDTGAVKKFLASHIRDGFASSAYWGVTGKVPPREPDDVARRKPHRFEPEISRKLVPLSEDKTSLPRTLDYTLIGLHRLKDNAEITPQLNSAQLLALEGSRHLVGDGSRADERKPRLLENTTTQNRTIGKGTFDPDVLTALQKEGDVIENMTNERERLKGEPVKCATPDMYRPSSWDYCDMSGIDPSSYCVTQKDMGAPDGIQVPVYKSRYNLVTKEGPVRREKTKTMLDRERNVDTRQLKEDMKSANASSMPEGYQPWSASDWISTAHDYHAPYDIAGAVAMNTRNATRPLPRTYHTLTAEHEKTVLFLKQRQLSRHDGNWATEFSDSYADCFDKADINKEYCRRSIFDIKDCVYTMHHSAHHPRDDTSTGETYTPSQIVPGQYTSMARQPLHAPNALN